MSISPWTIAQGDNPLEAAEQRALFLWANMARHKGFVTADNPASYGVRLDTLKGTPIPELEYMHSIPNGGWLQSKHGQGAAGANMKAQGVKPGVCDIFWPMRSGDYSGLYIELKRVGHKGNADPDQIKFMGFVADQGFAISLSNGWRHASREIICYFGYRYVK